MWVDHFAGVRPFSFHHTSPAGRKSFRACWRGLYREDDGRWRLAGLTQDLTELNEARDAALAGARSATEANEVKSRFLANMSHEFRTPLNGVLGVLHLLGNEPLSDSGRGLLEEAAKCGRTLTALLNDLLDLAHLDVGKLSLSRERVDVTALLQSVLEQYRPQFEAKSLSLQALTAPEVLAVIIDPIRLRQIVAGFIGNAAKFTESGGVTLRLMAAEKANEHTIRIEVEDTGVGIAAETVSELFTRFRQGDDSTTRSFGGAGVGLSLSRSLARLMGGEVGASSEPGRGSTFWVEVPAPLAAESASSGSDAAPGGLAVLVVDDNATNRLIAERILEQLGAVVDTANDGALAVAAVAQGDFDLVLMDIQMPVMDGIEATLNIRALPGPAGDTPIVAMTANISAEQVKSYEAAGMNGVIAKPASPEAIMTTIERLAAGGSAPSIYQILYYSRASTGTLARLSEAMDDILTVSGRLNSAANITGALLGCEGWFLQALEGPQEAVEAAFDRISIDVRHTDITVIRNGNEDHRLFGAWSMVGGLSSPTDRAMIEVLGIGLFDPPSFTNAEALGVLRATSGVQAASQPLLSN